MVYHLMRVKEELVKMNLFTKLLLCFGFVFILFETKVWAEENEEEFEILTVELNDAEAVSSIKKQLIEAQYSTDNTVGLLNSIDIEASEIKLDGLDVSKLGYQDILIHMNVKNNSLASSLMLNNLFSKKIRVQVIDTLAPNIELKYEHIYLDYKEELDPLEWIEEITDNDNIENILLDVDTSGLDITVAGDYKIIYQASDASGNTSQKTLLVTVKEEVKPYTYYGSNDDYIDAMLSLINNARASYGLSAYSLGSEAAQKAVGVRACEAASYTSHTRPDGRHYKTAFDDYNVSYSSPYEVLTYAGTSVEDKFNWWMNSSGHRNILLRSSSSKIAIGYCGKMWAAIAYD